MAHTAGAMNLRNLKIEANIASGGWTDISGSANAISGSGGGRTSTKKYAFGDSNPIVQRGPKDSRKLEVTVFYTEVLAEAFTTMWNAHENDDDVQIRVSPAGGGSGDYQFTSDPTYGFLTDMEMPAGNADSGDVAMCKFTFETSKFTLGTLP